MQVLILLTGMTADCEEKNLHKILKVYYTIATYPIQCKIRCNVAKMPHAQFNI